MESITQNTSQNHQMTLWQQIGCFNASFMMYFEPVWDFVLKRKIEVDFHKELALVQPFGNGFDDHIVLTGDAIDALNKAAAMNVPASLIENTQSPKLKPKKKSAKRKSAKRKKT